MRIELGRAAACAALAVPLTVSLAATGVAEAGSYPVTYGSLGVASGAGSGAVQAGSAVALSGGGFAPGALVTFVLHSTPVVLGTTTAAATGWMHATVTIPSDTAAGRHSLLAEGAAPDGGTVVLSREITVRSLAAAPAASGGSLPFTGADVAALVGIAGAALLAGATALAASRRRRVAVDPVADETP